MKADRFLYTSQPGKGFGEFASRDSLPVRLKQNLRQPHATSDPREFEMGLGVGHWDEGGSPWVVCTYLERSYDDHKRAFVLSHSVLIPVPEYSSLAVHFDSSILAPLQRNLDKFSTDNHIEPLELQAPASPRHGITEEDMERLGSLREPALLQLLAYLFDQKPFNVRVRTSLEATAWASTLLKVSALASEGASPPTITTFSPHLSLRSHFQSQVLPDPSVRGGPEFIRSGGPAPSETATVRARRLAEAVKTDDLDDVVNAIETGRNFEEVSSAATPPRQAQSVRQDGQDAAGPRSPRNTVASGGTDVNEFNKGYEKALNERHEQLNARETEVSTREQRLNELVRRLNDQEKDLAVRQSQLNEDERFTTVWRSISRIDGFMQNELGVSAMVDHCGELVKEIIRDKKHRKQLIERAGKAGLFKEIENLSKHLDDKNRTKKELERELDSIRREGAS